MNNNLKASASLVAATVILGLVGCGKEETAAPKVENKPASGLQKAMDTAVGQAQKTATDVKAGAEKVGQDVSATASKAAADASKAAGDAVQAVGDKAKSAVDAAKQAVPQIAGSVSAEAQKLIEQAKALVAEKKYPEALNTLKSLGNVQLSPELAGLVESLKTQIQKGLANAAASEPAKALGNLPGIPKQ